MSSLTASVSPHIRSGRTTRRVMLDVIIALVPAIVASVILFGFRALMLTAISAAACVLCEYAWEKLRHEEITTGDLSAVVTGILLAFNVPASLPVWQLIIGDMAAILLVKMLFGGIGRNFMNPALVGRIILAFSFTSDMTNYSYPKTVPDVLTGATPLAKLTELDWSNFTDLLLGNHGGLIGCTCSLALIIGGVYLIARRVIKPTIPLAYIGSCTLFYWLFGVAIPVIFDFISKLLSARIVEWSVLFTRLFGGTAPILSIFMGGLLLGAIFMATDYTTSPFTNKGKLIYGIGCGFLTAAIRVFANSTEGVSFAIVLMNLLVPYINDLTRSKPLGGVGK